MLSRKTGSAQTAQDLFQRNIGTSARSKVAAMIVGLRLIGLKALALADPQDGTIETKKPKENSTQTTKGDNVDG